MMQYLPFCYWPILSTYVNVLKVHPCHSMSVNSKAINSMCVQTTFYLLIADEHLDCTNLLGIVQKAAMSIGVLSHSLCTKENLQKSSYIF